MTSEIHIYDDFSRSPVSIGTCKFIDTVNDGDFTGTISNVKYKLGF